MQQTRSIVFRVKSLQVTYFLLALLRIWCTAFNVIWRITKVLTKIGSRGQPLSCSGTPEGIRRLWRCFSFLFSTFFFPLRFCLLLVLFLGESCNEELQGWTEAVVGHATLLCSVERLKQKYNVDVNSRRDIKQFCTTTTTCGVSRLCHTCWWSS